MNSIGILYRTGQGVAADYTAAANGTESRGFGKPGGDVQPGDLYQKGPGALLTPKKRAQWLSKAAAMQNSPLW